MRVLVTGGSGFLGAALCRELVTAGRSVRVLDDHSRGRSSRLDDLAGDVEVVAGDVRDPEVVAGAAVGCEVVWHLAYVNGTRHFYERPDLVLEVGLKGTLNTIAAAVAAGCRRFVLASTSETYNVPTRVPTPEDERLVVPDVTNPRFSYGGGKIACELMALHLAGRRGLEPVVFRPHNVYGPDMGHEHVIPELVTRIADLSGGLSGTSIELPIQGDGTQTRAFCHVRDAARGCLLAGESGEAGGIYNVGTRDEVAIGDLARRLGRALGVDVVIVPGPEPPGSTPRRCPDISRLEGLGYAPRVGLDQGLAETARWYADAAAARGGGA